MTHNYRDPVKARTVHEYRSAARAVDDPVKLARAARIVRIALARQRLTLDDLNLPEEVRLQQGVQR